MHIAVIIPAYNIGSLLGEAIESVVGQSHPDWSLLVVDDGSDDDTQAVIARFTDPRIKSFRQPNLGVSAARNAGIGACLSSGPVRNQGYVPARAFPPSGGFLLPDALLFLDGDDWLAPHALSCLSKTLDAAPWAVAACGRYARVIGGGRTHLAAAPPDGCLLERLLTRNLFINGGHLLIRREAIETAGSFRQDLIYGEDWEYWTRLALLGQFVRVPSSAPVLFVRERPGSAVFARGTDPAASLRAMEAIYGNPDITDRLGRARLAYFGRRVRAETAWSVGRELIRHGRTRDGQRWLGRSIRTAPSLRRLILMGLSWFRFGPFRPYRPGSSQRFSSISPL